ncbi:MFS transporter, partial [Bacillus sp. S34]|nr:MFS transporter [Bacillus sp. S34]
AFVVNAIIGLLLGDEGGVWRVMFFICAIPAACLFFGMLRMPESPRWFAQAGRYSEAKAVLEQVRDGDVSDELDKIVEVAEHAKAQGAVTRAELRVPWVKRIITIGVVFGVLVQLTGVNAVMYFAPTILLSTGLGTAAALTATVGNGIVSVAAVAIGIFFLGRKGRRPLILVGEAGIVVSLAALGF